MNQNIKKYRNKLNKLIRITEKEYYTSKFESYTCNIKKTWQVIKNILNKNSTSISQSFNLNNKVTSDKEEIVNNLMNIL